MYLKSPPLQLAFCDTRIQLPKDSSMYPLPAPLQREM